MTTTDRYPFVTAVMDRRRIPAEAFPAWFVDDELGRRGFEVRDGQIFRDGDLAGMARFFSVEQTAELLPEVAWLRERVVCPWLGEVMGFMNWLLLDDRFEEQFLLAVVLGARGRTVRIDSGAHRDAVALRRYRLDALLERHGFGDGDAFLDREEDDPEYVRDVCARVNAVLAGAGLDPDASFVDTHHNPLQIGGLGVSNSTLARLSVELWTYDFDVLKGPFWRPW